MKNTRLIETLVGIFVAAGIAALFMLAMKVSNLNAFSNVEGYKVSAQFENIGGLKVLSSVSVGGVRIGRVTSIDFDQEDYEAVVTMAIDPQYNRLPTDTSASIFTSGLLGEQYVGFEPGGEEKFLKEGDTITLTQSAIVLEQVIGQFMFSKASEGAGE
jgi:phospholipid/cholesterol/gamma-HCH transport system substrate-binding protein